MKTSLARVAVRRLLPLMLLAGVVACGGDPSIETDDPTITDGSATGSNAAGIVLLSHGSDSAKVDVLALPTQDYKGTPVVPLSAVWAAGELKDDVSTLEFDFEGDDGFHPSMKGKCSKNILGTQLGSGYLVPETRSLVWDDALGLPGCYSVSNVAKIIALDLSP